MTNAKDNARNNGNERSVSEVLRDIFGNLQEIIRAEVRLAKTELREEAVRAKSSGALLGIGSVAIVYGLGFLLLSVVYALSRIMSVWVAALLVGIAMSAIGTGFLVVGRKRLQQMTPTAERTVENVKENIEWAKQQIK